MKRPAETQLVGETRSGVGLAAGFGSGFGAGGNPFAGISLVAPTPAASGGNRAAATPPGATPAAPLLFTAAASSTSGSGSKGFSAPAAGPASQPDAKSGGGSRGSTNPFMGLSLFSSPAPGSSFASAANSLVAQGASGTGTSEAFPRSSDGGHATANDATPAASPVATLHSAGATQAGIAKAPAAPAAAAEDGPSQGSDEQAPEEEEEGPRDAGEQGEPTGEEEDEVVFTGECKLWKLVRQSPTPAAAMREASSGTSVAEDADAKADGATSSRTRAGDEEKGWRWQERGCGIVHINRHGKTGAGRLVMRMRGVLKLLLNTPVFPTAKYEKLGQKSVRFVGVDVVDSTPKDGQVSLSAFRLSLQSGEQQAKFLAVLRDLSVPVAA